MAKRHLAIFLINVGYDVAHRSVCLKVLSSNVDLVVTEELVDLGQDAWGVFVDMQESMTVWVSG